MEGTSTRFGDGIGYFGTKSLVVNKKKISFGQSCIEYLGHTIDGQGVAMDPSKIEVVVGWPMPKQIKGLCGFFGTYRVLSQIHSTLWNYSPPSNQIDKEKCFQMDSGGPSGI